MKTLIRVAVMTLSLGAMPVLADSEVSSPPQAQPAQVQPAAGYVYSNGIGAPVKVYNTQQNRGTWLFPPNPSAK